MPTQKEKPWLFFLVLAIFLYPFLLGFWKNKRVAWSPCSAQNELRVLGLENK